MPLKTIKQLDEDNKATAVVYDHSNAKLVTKKNKLRRCRRDAFLSALPYRRIFSCNRYAENKPQTSSNTPQQKCKPANRRATRRTKQKLRFCVQTHLPLVPKTLSFELDPETPIASLKGLIRRKLGVRPQHQRLYVRGNIQLCDLLTLHENGIDKDDIISLSTDDAIQGGLKEPSRDKAEGPQPDQREESKAEEQSKQKGETTSDAQTPKKEAACKTDGLQALRYVKQKLQILIRNPLPRGPRTFCFQLDPETSISSLKKLIHSKIGVQLQHQCLYIRRNFRNFKLFDLLTLNDCGIQQDENVLLRLSTDGLRGGGPKVKRQMDNFLQDLSPKVHEFLIEFATILGFKESEIKHIQSLSEDNEERCDQMLLSWWGKQENHAEGLKRLRGALVTIGLNEMALLVPDTFEEEANSSEVSAGSNRNEKMKQEQTDRSEQEVQEDAGVEQKVKKGKVSEEQRLAKEKPGGQNRSQPPHDGDQEIKEHRVVKETIAVAEQKQAQQQVCFQGNTHPKEMPSLEEHMHWPGQTGHLEAPQPEEKQTPVGDSKIALKRGIPLPEDHRVKRSKQEQTGQTPVDDVHESRVAKHPEGTVREPSPFAQQIMQIPKSVYETVLPVDQLETDSALSTLYSHRSAPTVSVESINVQGTNNPVFLGKVDHPTFNFVTVANSIPDGRAKSRAQEAAIQCRKELEERYTTTGGYVQLLPWVDDDMKHIKYMYTKLRLKRRGGVDIEGDVQKYEDIFVIETTETLVVKRAILCGLAGVGKSTIIDKIAYDWAVGCEVLKRFTLLFVLKMSALNQTSELIEAVFDQLLTQDTPVNKRDLKTFIYSKDTSSGVLILLDGFDEFQTTNFDTTKFGSVLKMLNRKVGRDWFVVVTTRPSHLPDLIRKSLVENPFTCVDILGFGQKDVGQYVKRFYSPSLDKARGLLNKINSSKVLYDLAKSPMLLLLMCLLWREEAQLPDTLSRLYKEAMEYIFRRKSPCCSKQKISEVVTGVAIAIGKPALEGLIFPEQRLSFQEGEFEKSVLDEAMQAGILTSQRVIKRLDPHTKVQFIHKTFQECCAAVYCQSLDGEKFQQILEQIENPRAFEYMLRFCCGDNEQCTKYVLDTLCEESRRRLHWDTVDALSLDCYFESQSTDLLSVDFIEQHIKPYMYIDYRNGPLNSLMYLLENVSKHVRGGDYLGRVTGFRSDETNLSRFSEVIASCLKGMKQLLDLQFSYCTLSAGCVNRMLTAVGTADVADLKSLHLSGSFGLGGTANVWAPQLRFLKKLENLDLNSCDICTQDMPHIASSIGELSNLANLNLSFNEALGGHAETWTASLKGMVYLKKLTMTACDIKCRDVTYLVEAISGMDELMDCDFTSRVVRLSVLSSDRCIHVMITAGSLSGEDMADLIQSLANRRDLVGLHLFCLDGAAALWSPLLTNLMHLEELRLSSCSLQSTDIAHLAAAMSQMPRFKKLNLHGNATLGGSVENWAPQIQGLKNLTKLDLSSCDLKKQDVPHIVSMVGEMINLTDLNLSENKDLGCFEKVGGTSFKSMLSLRKLAMTGCSTDDNDVKYLSKEIGCMNNSMDCHFAGINSAAELRVLSLDNGTSICIRASSLTGADLADILRSLSHRRDLAWLQLMHIPSLSGSAGLWTPLLQTVTHLQGLYLLACSLQSRDIGHLAELLGQIPTLKELSLQGNTTLGGSAETWAPCLVEIVHVVLLDFSRCDLQPIDVVHLAAALSQMPTLKILSLEENWSLGGQANMWAPSLHDMVRLEHLLLRKCNLQNIDMEHLAAAVGHMAKLDELNLERNRLLRGSAEAWAYSLKQMDHVRLLKLGACSWKTKDLKYISEVRKRDIDYESDDESYDNDDYSYDSADFFEDSQSFSDDSIYDFDE